MKVIRAGETLDIVFGDKGRVTFRIYQDDGKQLVFRTEANSLGETLFTNPTRKGAYVPKGDVELSKIAKPLAPRTARRHFKALVENVALSELA